MTTDTGPSIQNLYLRQPTMEYGQAFDLAAQRLNAADGPALAVLSAAAHATELLKRCPGALALAGTGHFDAADFVAGAGGWAWGPLTAVELGETGEKFSALLWAEPEAATAAHVAIALRERAKQSATLSVITTGPLRRFLPVWHESPTPAERPLTAGAVRPHLKWAGWRVERTIAFHGPRSIAWTRLGWAAERLGRRDIGDRCSFAMRASYREPGWLWPLAPLALTLATAP